MVSFAEVAERTMRNLFSAGAEGAGEAEWPPALTDGVEACRVRRLVNGVGGAGLLAGVAMLQCT